jgi:hypothetical protein
MTSATLKARFLPALSSTAVRYDIAQTLSSDQKAQARDNIGAAIADVTTAATVSPIVLVQADDVTLAINSGLIAADFYELPSGIALELQSESILEIS